MKLPRLQLHLLTLLMITLLAAWLVWLNARECPLTEWDADQRAVKWSDRVILGDNPSLMDDHGQTSSAELLAWRGRGWPWIFQGFRRDSAHWNEKVFLLDVAVCLGLVAVAAVAIEWLAQRMKPLDNEMSSDEERVVREFNLWIHGFVARTFTSGRISFHKCLKRYLSTRPELKSHRRRLKWWLKQQFPSGDIAVVVEQWDEVC